EANIGIPYPTHEVHLCRVSDDLTRVIEQPPGVASSGVSRFDPAAVGPPPPHRTEATVPDPRHRHLAEGDEGVHRVVDE
ncbi:MAG TPA: hypothetical protein VKF17_11880, partial [Isosphaeraceae bacterium]|nr:hypothetical protein [Isosphaeraceae bacterium]